MATEIWILRDFHVSQNVDSSSNFLPTSYRYIKLCKTGSSPIWPMSHNLLTLEFKTREMLAQNQTSESLRFKGVNWPLPTENRPKSTTWVMLKQCGLRAWDRSLPLGCQYLGSPEDVGSDWTSTSVPALFGLFGPWTVPTFQAHISQLRSLMTVPAAAT